MTEFESAPQPSKLFPVPFTPKTLEYLQRNFKPETLDRKIKSLYELGFHDPIKLIERFP
jgi:hypothetical protein